MYCIDIYVLQRKKSPEETPVEVYAKLSMLRFRRALFWWVWRDGQIVAGEKWRK